jgi:hypothetical protein
MIAGTTAHSIHTVQSITDHSTKDGHGKQHNYMMKEQADDSGNNGMPRHPQTKINK